MNVLIALTITGILVMLSGVLKLRYLATPVAVK